jgi:hypothetical protein
MKSFITSSLLWGENAPGLKWLSSWGDCCCCGLESNFKSAHATSSEGEPLPGELDFVKFWSISIIEDETAGIAGV